MQHHSDDNFEKNSVDPIAIHKATSPCDCEEQIEATCTIDMIGLNTFDEEELIL